MMKTRTFLFFCGGAFVLVLGGLTHGQETSADPSTITPKSSPPGFFESDQARVTLPYAEVRRLWEAAKAREAEPKEAKPPIQAVVRALRADVTIGEENVQLSARFEVESYDNAWHTVPLLGGSGRLVRVEPEDAGVVWRDGGYVLLRQETGPVSLTLEFTSPRQRGSREQILELEPREATVQVLSVTGVPAERGLELNGSPLVVTDGVATAALPQNSGSVKLSLISQPAEREQPKEVVPSTWEISSQILARYADGALHHQARVFARDRTGEGESLGLRLPKNARNVEISSNALERSRPGRTSEGDLVYQLSWEDAGTLDRQIELSFDLPVSPLAESWPLSVPRAEPGESSEALFVIPLAEGLEIGGDGVTASAEAQRISGWFREKLGNADFVSLQANADAQVSPRWLPRRSTAQATIVEACFETQLEKNGQTLNRAAYTIEHDHTLVWQTTLPEGCEVLKCTVDGRPTTPVARDERTIELSLAGDSGETQVSLDYAHRGEPLSEIEGSLTLTLPETPLFIHKLCWDLRIPGVFAITAVDGNVEPTESSSKSANAVSLLKQLCQGEAPAVEVFYRRPTANE